MQCAATAGPQGRDFWLAILGLVALAQRPTRRVPARRPEPAPALSTLSPNAAATRCESTQPPSDDDESEFEEAPGWSELPEEDVLDAFDEDELDDEPLDDWAANKDDDEPSWFD